MAELDHREGPGFTFHGGSEFWVHPSMALRVGYDDTAPAGGVSYRVSPVVRFDYGLSDHELGVTHRIGLSYRFGGFFAAMAIGVLCIYAVLVLLFHDFIQPLTILGALPQAVGGALTALLIFGHGLSLPSLIGLLMLMGIVTKNSILLVEYVVMARTNHGMSRMEALIDACAKRARPIIMTTIAMIAGMFPVAAGWSADPSFRSPMGLAVIGGLITSTALSLFVVPTVYTVLDDFQEWLRRKLRRHPSEAEPAPAHS